MKFNISITEAKKKLLNYMGIEIHTASWRDKTYGNTYSKAFIKVVDTRAGSWSKKPIATFNVRFQYGDARHLADEAVATLIKHGYVESTEKRSWWNNTQINHIDSGFMNKRDCESFEGA